MRTRTQGGKELKDNSRKKAFVRQEHDKVKRAGRPKQVWVESTVGGLRFGRFERVV